MAALLKPGLYREEGTIAAPDLPALVGGACGACGYVFFPMQTYGCEKCGSLDLAPRPLTGAGRLVASARVHLHAGKGREAPFTIVAVKLDDGPVVRTLADDSTADDSTSDLTPGQRMTTGWATVTDTEGEPRLDLRFKPEA